MFYNACFCSCNCFRFLFLIQSTFSNSKFSNSSFYKTMLRFRNPVQISEISSPVHLMLHNMQPKLKKIFGTKTQTKMPNLSRDFTFNQSAYFEDRLGSLKYSHKEKESKVLQDRQDRTTRRLRTIYPLAHGFSCTKTKLWKKLTTFAAAKHSVLPVLSPSSVDSKLRTFQCPWSYRCFNVAISMGRHRAVYV